MMTFSLPPVRSVLRLVSLAAVSLSVGFVPCIAGAANEAGGLEEIVVTAQKREQSFQSLATAAAVVTKEELDKKGINTVQDAIRLVPGVKVQNVAGSGAGRIFIRGVGTTGRGDEYSEIFANGVAMNLDGVNSNNASNLLGTMFDVERVEVLKGPQGTLYGSSALGGVVNVITARPTHEFEAEFKLQAGDYSARLGQAMVNIPLGDKFAVRLNASKNERDGYVGGPATYTFGVPPPLQAAFLATWGSFTLPADNHGSVDSESYRVRALWTPADALSAMLSYEKTSDQGTSPTWVNVSDALAGNLVCCTLNLNPGPPPFAVPQWFANAYYQRGGETWTGEITYDFGRFGVLTFQPSVNKLTDVGRSQELSAATLAVSPALEQTQETYELRLNSAADSRVTWVAGAYLSTSERQLGADTGLRAPSPNVDNNLATVEYRVFEIGKPFDTSNLYAQVTAPFSDQLRGTAGIRYSDNEQGYSYQVYRTANPCTNPDPMAPTCPTSDTVVESAEFSSSATKPYTTWKVGLEYDLAPDRLLYGNVATGFKSGGLQLFDVMGGAQPVTQLAALNLSTFKPERTLSYELGSKNRLLDNTLQLNASLFYTVWDDLQINTFVCAADPCIAGVTQQYPTFLNVVDSKQYGLEVDLIWAIAAADRLSWSSSFMHGRYGAGGYTSFGNQFIDLTDKDMVQTPAAAATAAYSHIFHIGKGSLTATLDGEYSAEYETTHESNLLGHTQPSYFRNNASLTWQQGLLTVNAFIRNIQNETTIQSVFPFGVQVGEPRLWGVSVDFKL